jgi:hypothetical protein
MNSRAPRHLCGLALIATAITSIGCRSSDVPGVGRSRSETAIVGDTMIVRTIGGAGSASLRLIPDLRIGELEGPEAYTFGSVDAIAPAPDGGVYVWDQRSHVLRRFGAAGNFVRRIGRRGGGPGEYEKIGTLSVVAGRLVFWDRETQHVTVYDSCGALQASWMPAAEVSMPSELTAIGDHLFLRHTATLPAEADQGSAYTVFAGYDLTGVPTGDTLRPLPATIADSRPPYMYAGKMSHFAVEQLPFAPTSLVRLSPLGTVVSGTGDRYALLLTRRGRTPLRIEREVAPVRVSEEERADEEARITARLRTVASGWSWSGPPIPSHKPYFRDVRFDADGRLWVERALPSTRVPDAELSEPTPDVPLARRWRAGIAYDLYDTDGRFLGSVERPRGAIFLHMRGDTVWGATRDSLDVEYVTRWHIEPSVVRPR